jgi:hypothetical protein
MLKQLHSAVVKKTRFFQTEIYDRKKSMIGRKAESFDNKKN